MMEIDEIFPVVSTNPTARAPIHLLQEWKGHIVVIPLPHTSSGPLCISICQEIRMFLRVLERKSIGAHIGDFPFPIKVDSTTRP